MNLKVLRKTNGDAILLGDQAKSVGWCPVDVIKDASSLSDSDLRVQFLDQLTQALRKAVIEVEA